MSSSVSNISFRYHPEDEQLEDSYETSSSISTSSISTKSGMEGFSIWVKNEAILKLSSIYRIEDQCPEHQHNQTES